MKAPAIIIRVDVPYSHNPDEAIIDVTMRFLKKDFTIPFGNMKPIPINMEIAE